MKYNELRKLENENEDQYIWRIGQEVDKGEYRWDDIKDIISKEIGLKEDEYRTESAYRKKYQNFKRAFDNVFSKLNVKTNDELSSVIEDQIAELRMERIKTQTEKVELNKWIREYARDEMIVDKITTAITNLSPLPIPKPIEYKSNNKEYILCISDIHFGKELSIEGLFGETLNEYSPEISMQRMWDLLYKTIEIIKKENITTLNVWDGGDELDGLLRVSQLFTLRYGVIDSTIIFSDFFANWLNELSNHVNIKFQMVIDSNHCQLRELGQPKNTFKNDNLSKVILAFLKERLKHNPNIEIVENPTGYIFENICGFNVLGIHGEVKNMKIALSEFSNVYNTKINYLIGGHLHHSKSEEVGFDMEVINVPSIIGVDDYSISLRMTSNAGAKLLCFEENKGKTIEYSIKLN